jgi:hypothetical protein
MRNKPSVFYNETGDTLNIQWNNKVSEVGYFVNKFLTILKSAEDENEIIGIEIKGIKNFALCGMRIDPMYDSEPPLTEQEREDFLNKMNEVFGDKVMSMDIVDTKDIKPDDLVDEDFWV